MAKSFLHLFYVVCLIFFADVSFALMKTKSHLKQEDTPPTPTQQVDTSYAILNTKCSNDNCNPNLGTCSENMCVCNEEYAHLAGTTSNAYPNSSCNYEKKKMVIAFLLEFFIPFGTSHFYLGKHSLGLLKFALLFILPILLITIFCNCWRPNHNRIKVKATSVMCYFLGIVYVLSLVGWLVTDIVFIVTSRYTDQYGVPLSKTTSHKN